MLALRVRGAGDVCLEVVPTPVPSPGEAVVRVLLAGLCGTDLEIVDGRMTYFTSGLAQYPVTLGHEWVGEVAALGAGVASPPVGARVVGECSVGCGACATCAGGAYHRCAARSETGILRRDGGCAEFLVLPAASLHAVSPSLLRARGAAAAPVAAHVTA